ncbi:copia protein [Tanacetum coccineum]
MKVVVMVLMMASAVGGKVSAAVTMTMVAWRWWPTVWRWQKMVVRSVEKAAGGIVMMVDLAWRWLSWRWCGGVASAVGGCPEVGQKKGDKMMGVMMICRSMLHVNRSVVVRRFNHYYYSLKALNEVFSSKNFLESFLGSTSSMESKVTALKNEREFRKKRERVKSIALKAKKESSDDETSTSGSDDKEYAIAVRNFKKFFRRKGKFVRQPREEKKSFRQRDEKKGKSDRKCFRCGDPNHLFGDCAKPSCNKDQKAFIGGSWSDSEKEAEDKINDETCLMAQSSNEVCFRTCLEPDEWIKDSGCSKHMTGNKSLFSTYKAYDEGNVVFGSNLKGKIIGKCTISNGKHYLIIFDNIQDDGATRDTSRLRFFHFSLKGKAAEWFDKIPPTQITTWDQLIHINLSFLEAMIHMPKGAIILNDILSHKEKLEKAASTVSFPVEFVVLEMDEEELVLIILGRPFLATARAVIDVHEGNLSKNKWVDTVDHDGKWTEVEEEEGSNKVPAVSFYPKTEPVEPLEWKAPENKLKPSSIKPPKLELKELPEHLEYAFLQENNQLPVVISSALSTVEKARLCHTPPRHENAMA